MGGIQTRNTNLSAVSTRTRASSQPSASQKSPGSRALAGSLHEFIRVMRVTILVLALGTAWTFMSRLPDAAPQHGSPPPNPKEGFSAPDFALDSLDGGRLTLSGLRGQPVVVNVWASWCFPCRAEMPALERAYQSYRDEGLIILGVNMTSQDSAAAARAFVQEHGLTFPMVLDREGLVSKAYQVLGLPSTYFVDRAGVIRSVVVGGPMSDATLSSHIEDLLEAP